MHGRTQDCLSGCLVGVCCQNVRLSLKGWLIYIYLSDWLVGAYVRTQVVSDWLIDVHIITQTVAGWLIDLLCVHALVNRLSSVCICMNIRTQTVCGWPGDVQVGWLYHVRTQDCL